VSCAMISVVSLATVDLFSFVQDADIIAMRANVYIDDFI
jgi:hypothetical protein